MYGDVGGSSPDWVKAAFVDRGRAHLKQSGELEAVGLKGWTPAEPVDRRMRYARTLPVQMVAVMCMSGGRGLKWAEQTCFPICMGSGCMLLVQIRGTGCLGT